MALIKICGLSREEDITAVNEAKPDYCGFIINFPKSHRNVTVERVRQLRTGLRPEIIPVGVIVDQPVEKAAMLLNEGVADVIQLHGQEDETYIRQLRKLLKCRGRSIWKAFKIRSRKDLESAMASSVDAVVLDNGYGAGETFDWSIIEDAGKMMEGRKVFLAGGMTPENIEEAIHRLDVCGIDISSGVETDKKKDRNKILTAVQAAGRAGGNKQ